MSRNRAIGYTPTANRRRFLFGLIGIGGAATSAGTFVLGRTTATTPAASTPSSDLLMREGIPVPNRRTIAGAATAAQNFQVAGFRISTGTLDPAAAAAVLLSSQADDRARQTLSPTPTQAQVAYAPVSTVLVTFSHRAAEMQVWGVAATSALEGQPDGIENWGRATVRLTWETDQWRVVSQRFEPGPWPARADARFAEPSGDFGFRANELRQSGWSYVPEP
jgi:hypothetical protein